MENKSDSQQSDWRKMSTGLLDDLKHVLMNGRMTDLTIRLINGEDIKDYKVHKLVFQLASEVFDRMINSPFKEGLSNIIEIKDVKPDIFQLLLNSLYGQPLIISHPDQALELLHLADYYLVHSLKYNIMKYISENTKEVVESENFLEVSLESMETIVEQEKFSIREIDLFKAVQRWIDHNLAEKGESIKKILIPKFRYSCMTLSEFIDGPVASKLFEWDDLAPLMSHLFSSNCSAPLPEGFTEAKRICTNQLTTESLPLLQRNDSSNTIRFFANKRITLTHFFIYPAQIADEEEYQENIGIYHDKTQIAQFSGMVNGADKIEMKLDQKFQLNKHETYQLNITSSSSNKRNVVYLTDKIINCEKISLKFVQYVHSNGYGYDSYFPIHSLLFEC